MRLSSNLWDSSFQTCFTPIISLSYYHCIKKSRLTFSWSLTFLAGVSTFYIPVPERTLNLLDSHSIVCWFPWADMWVLEKFLQALPVCVWLLPLCLSTWDLAIHVSRASLSHWWWSLVITERCLELKELSSDDVIVSPHQNQKGPLWCYLSFQKIWGSSLALQGNVEKYLKWYDQIKSFFQGSADGWIHWDVSEILYFLQLPWGTVGVSGSRGWVFTFHQWFHLSAGQTYVSESDRENR